MVEALFITNLELNENEGIYKKIYAEATAIGKAVGSCNLLMKCGSGTKVVDTLYNMILLRKLMKALYAVQNQLYRLRHYWKR